MMIKKPVILVCTVGGSPQPIVTAIQSLQPIFTEFICTDKDPGTGQQGSCVCINGAGKVCKSNSRLEAPDLPNIPAMAGLEAGQFGITIIPSDDLDIAFVSIRKKLAELYNMHPEAVIVADYTGGTKTMTAALVTAVLETEDIELQLVTGNRADLFKVKDGTETVVSASIDTLKYEKAIQPYLSAWNRFAFDEAAMGLSSISPPPNSRLRTELFCLKDLSFGFAAWDCFDHRTALSLLDLYAPSKGKNLGKYLGVLRILTEESPKKEPMQLLDLWLNAQRRAFQGRFDDAMGRCYRMIEWAAQWILHKDHKVDAANLPVSFVPKEIKIYPAEDGKLQAGLMKAWKLIRLKHSGPAKQFIETEKNHLLDRIKTRNSSILAHGKTPIDQKAWEKMADWIESRFVPMLLQESVPVGIKSLPEQLPWDAKLFRDSAYK